MMLFLDQIHSQLGESKEPFLKDVDKLGDLTQARQLGVRTMRLAGVSGGAQ
jgi:hypothetical protein